MDSEEENTWSFRMDITVTSCFVSFINHLLVGPYSPAPPNRSFRLDIAIYTTYIILISRQRD